MYFKKAPRTPPHTITHHRQHTRSGSGGGGSARGGGRRRRKDDDVPAPELCRRREALGHRAGALSCADATEIHAFATPRPTDRPQQQQTTDPNPPPLTSFRRRSRSPSACPGATRPWASRWRRSADGVVVRGSVSRRVVPSVSCSRWTVMPPPTTPLPVAVPLRCCGCSAVRVSIDRSISCFLPDLTCPPPPLPPPPAARPPPPRHCTCPPLPYPFLFPSSHPPHAWPWPWTCQRLLPMVMVVMVAAWGLPLLLLLLLLGPTRV